MKRLRLTAIKKASETLLRRLSWSLRQVHPPSQRPQVRVIKPSDHDQDEASLRHQHDHFLRQSSWPTERVPPIGTPPLLKSKLKAREHSCDHVVDLLACQGPTILQHHAERDDDVTIRPQQIVGHLVSKTNELLGGLVSDTLAMHTDSYAQHR